MKKLGFGLMRLPTKEVDGEKKIDIEHLKEMVDTFLARGFTYFDTAWMYCNFQSECAIREALVVRHPRDAYTLATKLHSSFVKTKEDRDRIFGEQLKKTGVTYFDYYLLHAIGRENYAAYNDMDCFTWLRDKKAAGLVRHMGFSFHDDAEFLDQVLTEHPEMEFVQLQINYLDWDSEGVQSRKCYEVATRHGVPVIVMEPVKGGTLVNIPEEAAALIHSIAPGKSPASQAIRFVRSLEGISTVLSGMGSVAQMADNLSPIQPMTREEMDVMLRAAEMIRKHISIGCTGCGYCLKHCPRELPIPTILKLYNEYKFYPRHKWKIDPAYRALPSKASDCIGCGSCEANCPQKLQIASHMKTVAETLEA